MAYKDYYSILGVSQDASLQEIKKSYRKLARLYHPDTGDAGQKTHEKFRDITEAYDTLCDPEARDHYDKARAIKDQWFQTQNFDSIKDIFERSKAKAKAPPRTASPSVKKDKDQAKSTFGKFADIFSNLVDSVKKEQTAYTASGDVPPEDIHMELPITLEEAYQGRKKNITVPTENPCVLCGGKGDIGSQTCRNCYGQGKVKKQKKLEVTIPPHVRQGARLRITGEGNGLGENRGHLFLTIQIQPHAFFKLQDNGDIHCEIPISIPEAVLGTEIEVPTLGGLVKMKIPAGTPTGKVFRLRGRGLKAKGHDEQGDQHVTVQLQIPKTLSQREQELYQELGRKQEDLRKHLYSSL